LQWTLLQRARGPQRRFEIRSKVWPSEIHSPVPDMKLNWGFTPVHFLILDSPDR
jgi:hypothetical protein